MRDDLIGKPQIAVKLAFLRASCMERYELLAVKEPNFNRCSAE